MPSESPTRIRSTPASATSLAVGKSYAVSMARRAPLLRRSSRTVGFFTCSETSRLQRGKVVELAIEKMGRLYFSERARDRFDAPGVLALPVAQHLADHLALQVLLRAAQVARNDRERLLFGVGGEVVLGDIGERADDDMLAIVGAKLGRHRLELAAVEEVEEERGEDVVAMMAERDLRRAELAGGAIERAAAQARAERAHGLALRHDALHHGIGVLLDDAEGHAARLQILRQHVPGESRLLLVEVHRDELEAHRRLGLQREQHIQQRVAVLAAGEAHHDAVALGDHAEVGDRLAHLAADAFGELSGLVVGFAAVAQDGNGHTKRERPPSTAMICPVTYEAQARKCTACATSSGEPVRASGVVARMRARSSASNCPSSGQAIAPGATPFTRTCSASSRASERVSAARPPLAMV